MLFLMFNMIAKREAEQKVVTFSEFMHSVNLPETDINRIVKVTIKKNDDIVALTKEGTSLIVHGPKQDADLRNLLLSKAIALDYEQEEEGSLWKSVLINSLPMLLLLFLFFFFMRQLQIGGGKAISFGKSRARLQNDNKNKLTFKDVAGVDEAKEELVEIVEFLKDPKKFTRLGGRIPKGVLLVGPPGTGKTILAKAISGEADVPFFSISGSEFVEMFVGVGASRVRDLFEQAKKNAPCLVFIDEIDAVGRQRGAGLGGGHDEREQTLNQLLVEMDGFDANEGVILIAATNRADVLDPALLRPGRFDRRVYVPKPDIKGRCGILKVHSRRTPLAEGVDLKVIAQGTPGFSGADLENLVNEAALIAARNESKEVNMHHFELAKDKVMMGPERRSMIISEKEKRNTACHEAGHCLVASSLPGADPVHKISIIPRGHALGVTILLPEEDLLTMSKEYAEGMIAYAMGGRAAEEIVFGQITTGAGNDIEKATSIARKMVCNWGMSEKIGPLALGNQSQEVFLGKEMMTHEVTSNKVLEEIDSEVRRFVTDGHEKALRILKERREILDNMTEALLIRESLGADEIRRLIAGEKLISEEEKEDYEKRKIEKQKEWGKDMKTSSKCGTDTDASDTSDKDDRSASELKTMPLGT
ncbi:MAG: ATP-dependent zinc metalloprotease FtsH [Oligoflexales bacterium]|nr:ATP-dependent zinc metalloprotease FtsH [Oligoflexales bacterium]